MLCCVVCVVLCCVVLCCVVLCCVVLCCVVLCCVVLCCVVLCCVVLCCVVLCCVVLCCVVLCCVVLCCVVLCCVVLCCVVLCCVVLGSLAVVTLYCGESHVVDNVMWTSRGYENTPHHQFVVLLQSYADKKDQIRNEVEEINQFTNTPPEFTVMPTDQRLIKHGHFIHYSSYTS